MSHLALYIPWLPALATILCGLCCTRKSLRIWAAPICIAAIAAAFVLSLIVSRSELTSEPVTAFEWITAGTLHVGFSYFIDPLTIIMLFVVTGIGTLVAIYAAGYMKGDRGYARFFAGVSLFIFAMTTLVLADNLVLLYLGWEGVGLCSYLLIGYYYDKPSAVAAAKKAFIVNRIGDLGFALGIFLTWQTYHTVSLYTVTEQAGHAVATGATPGTADLWIPFLLMLGAFGKSAQIPLYVWLPDAMEGPTPVSALIHAATMVTAGVYMIARLLPVFQLSPYALPTVATVGTATALLAALIALCQYDIKRIWAYSTISQLGYMFMGVGALSSAGGIFHLFTHAFFKALLFLTAGSVMHAMAGQLDLRKMSGLRTRMPITAGLMLIGCFALAGLPPFAGFFSKDAILAAAMDKGLNESNVLFVLLAVVGLATALLTAYYTFRLWFRVFMGPVQFQMGEEHHGDDNAHAPQGHDEASRDSHDHAHGPHEMPWLMNGPLVVLALGAMVTGGLCHGWIDDMMRQSTAFAGVAHAATPHAAGATHEGGSHNVMMILSGLIAVAGIMIAAYYPWLNRAAADRVGATLPGVVRVLANKFYVDEIYDAAIVRPLRLTGELCFAFDRLIIDGLVSLVGVIPGLTGRVVQPAQQGRLQGYGLGMAVGAAIVIVLVVAMM